MTLSARDRKILLALIPLVLVAAYWFLLLAPKREEASAAQDQLTQAQSERDTATQRLAGLSAAKQSFGRDYATVVYLGKSIPTTVDMPSLLVQLDRAARGTGIRFTSIKTGDRAASASTPAANAPASGANAPASGANAPASAPASSGTAPAAGSTASSQQGSLDTIPLDFEFSGGYFDLTSFFHRMKRFVRVSNDKILVRGRLMTVNKFTFEVDQETHALKATVHATVYLSPKTEGVSAGATSQGPAGAPTPPAGQSASASSTPPAASVIAR